jgi:hypothetical protein
MNRSLHYSYTRAAKDIHNMEKQITPQHTLSKDMPWKLWIHLSSYVRIGNRIYTTNVP